MRLQSKKLNQISYPPIILAVFLASMVYWVYLALTSSMIIVFDAVGYESFGRMIQTQGWIPYFTSGPNREPFYPFLISLSMSLTQLTGIAYVKFMAFFGVIILFLTQLLTYQILRLLNVRLGICVFILSYLALSPALNNAAFSLFSEIAAFPVVLGIILVSHLLWEAIANNRKLLAFFYSIFVGLLLMLATFCKASFECITPVFLVIFIVTILLREKKRTVIALFCLIVAATSYYAPITAYKWLNLHYNGNFVITDRGPWALYGSTARRMEPLTPKRLAEALSFAPGEGVCESFFGAQECQFWSFSKSDELGFAKLDELNKEHLSSQKINSTLIHLSAQKAMQNPFQYALLTLIEGLKMFFWESTKVGFVTYPQTVGKIYNIKLFNNGLRFVAFLFSFIGVLSLWRGNLKPDNPSLCFLMGLLIFLYILSFSFFFILTRYALPMAPLYLICFGLWLDQKLAHKK